MPTTESLKVYEKEASTVACHECHHVVYCEPGKPQVDKGEFSKYRDTKHHVSGWITCNECK